MEKKDEQYEPIPANLDHLSSHNREYMIKYLSQLSLLELDDHYAQYDQPHFRHLWCTRRLHDLKLAVIERINQLDAEREDYLRHLPHTD